MKRLILLFIVVFSFFPASFAHAIGFGLYGSYGLGSADWDDGYYTDFSTDMNHKAAGISFDTSLSGRRLFNYHLNIGREVVDVKDFTVRDILSSTAAYVSDVELSGISMSHTFGFGGEIAPGIKMWLGPQLSFSWLKGNPSNIPGFKLDGNGVGFGPSLGVNFNLPSGLTLVIKAGYLISRYDFDGEGIPNSLYAYNNQIYIYNHNYDVDENFTYVNLEIMFRTPGDR